MIDPITAIVGGMVLAGLSKQAKSPEVLVPGAGPSGGVFDIAEQAGAQHGVPAGMMSRLVMRESGGNPAARGLAGELGLCQFMPATWAEWGKGRDWRDPAANADAAARYLAWLRDQVGDWWLACAAYNWGVGNVRRCGGRQYVPTSVAGYASDVAGVL